MSLRAFADARRLTTTTLLETIWKSYSLLPRIPAETLPPHSMAKMLRKDSDFCDVLLRGKESSRGDIFLAVGIGDEGLSVGAVTVLAEQKICRSQPTYLALVNPTLPEEKTIK